MLPLEGLWVQSLAVEVPHTALGGQKNKQNKNAYTLKKKKKKKKAGCSREEPEKFSKPSVWLSSKSLTYHLPVFLIINSVPGTSLHLLP